jgi:hypothetical protein
MHAICPAQPVLLGLIILIMFIQDFKVQSSSLCNVFRSPVICSPLCPTFSSAPVFKQISGLPHKTSELLHLLSNYAQLMEDHGLK